MIEELLLSFIRFLKNLSYAGVAIALTFEFVPAELVLPLVGYWVYQGDMNMALAILAGTIGGTTGPLTLYLLGYFGGRPFVEKYGKYFFIREKQMQASDHFFEKYGASVAFLGRFIPGVRTVISIPCGIARMNIWKFSIYTFFAMLPITSIYIYVGFSLGDHWEEAGAIVKEYMIPAAVVIISGAVAYALWKKKMTTNAKRLS
jgi:membrane protein DedA with SNARE-associated domain